MIIIGGRNYYPADIEAVVERTSSKVRPGCVAAFGIDKGGDGEGIAVLAEAKRRQRPSRPRGDLPRDQETLSGGGRRPGARPARHDQQDLLGQDRAPVVPDALARRRFTGPCLARTRGASADRRPHRESAEPLRYRWLRRADARRTGRRFADAGRSQRPPRRALEGTARVARRTSPSRRCSTCAFSRRLPRASCARSSRRSPQAARSRRSRPSSMPAGWRRSIAKRGSACGATPCCPMMSARSSARNPSGGQVLLTGATGFLGSFLLEALLRLTDDKIVTVVRAEDDDHARARTESALQRTGLFDAQHRRGPSSGAFAPSPAISAGRGSASPTRSGRGCRGSSPGSITAARRSTTSSPITRCATRTSSSTLDVIRLASEGTAENAAFRVDHVHVRLRLQGHLLGDRCERRDGRPELRLRADQVGRRAARPGGDPPRAECQDLPAVAHLGVATRNATCAAISRRASSRT